MVWEDVLKVPIERMSAEDQNAFRSLANSHLHDGSPPLPGITRTNGFSACEAIGQVFELDDDNIEHRFTAVEKVLSRINHSCMPNATVVMEPHSRSLQLIAIRSIEPGEEITVAYCDMLDNHVERQRQLAPYGIVCDYPACANPEKSDKRRHRIRALSEYLSEEKFDEWIANPYLPEDYLTKPTEGLRDLVFAEGVQKLAKTATAMGLIKTVLRLVDAYHMTLMVGFGVTSPELALKTVDLAILHLKHPARGQGGASSHNTQKRHS
ncbi:hypothetical protein CERSUDRAFT_99066 [Gelatoporia subvermispora B]|uniref:SET domain-containing protein n=1 Tax=Ceriporiopsis subvermispora (strain B) TaxID=914234 RepID=M2PAW8_CERS8|nr:hypothetical protein CERSUDRAFT_99066 [Gelatoporia subvermispora B]